MDLNGDGKDNLEDDIWLFAILNSAKNNKDYWSDDDFSCCEHFSFWNIALVFMVVTLPFCFTSEYGWIGAIMRIVMIIVILMAKNDK